MATALVYILLCDGYDFISSLTAVVIGLRSNFYAVNENDGSVSLFIDVLEGFLDMGLSVLVEFTTEDRTALGMLLCTS